MEVLDQTTMEECRELTNSVIEARCNKDLECQRAKFSKLCEWTIGGHSNLAYNQAGGHFNFSMDTSVTTVSLTSTSSQWVKKPV